MKKSEVLYAGAYSPPPPRRRGESKLCSECQRNPAEVRGEIVAWGRATGASAKLCRPCAARLSAQGSLTSVKAL